MAGWSDENVTLEHGPVIKEGDHLPIARHHRSIQLTAHNLADHIGHRNETNALRRAMIMVAGCVPLEPDPMSAGTDSSPHTSRVALTHDFVMAHRQIPFDKEAVVFWIVDSPVDVVAGERPDAFLRVPQ